MTVLGALARGAESRAISNPWGDWGDPGQTHSGTRVTTTTALQLLTVYGCDRFIADGISTLPVDVLRRRPDGTPEGVRTPRWIENPTADLEFIPWATQVISSLLLAGNAYLYKTYAEGSINELIPLDPSLVTVERPAGRKTYRVNGTEVASRNILHIPGVMYPGADVGLSPVEAARQSIGVGMSAKEYGAKFFDQDSTPGGVIEVPGELQPDAASAMAQSWRKKHGGKAKNGLPAVLQGGAVWKQTSVTNEQAQFLETQKFTASEIAGQMFLIDPAELGLPVDGSSITYQNLEQRNARKVQVTFLPWIVRLEKALTSLLPRPQYVKLNVNGLLRGDSKARWETYEIASRINTAAAPVGQDPVLLTSEMRDFEDLGVVEAPALPTPTPGVI